MLRKFEPLDYNEYMAAKTPARPLTEEEIDRAMFTQDLSASLGPQPETIPEQREVSTTFVQQVSASSSTDADLPYPATFAEIVELIKSGKPIPGKHTT